MAMMKSILTERIESARLLVMESIFECTQCDWIGPSHEIESHTYMPARYDPPDPGEYLDKCPRCGSLESMEEVEEEELCEACGVARKYKHGEDYNYCWPCLCEAAEAHHDLTMDR